VPFFRSEKLDKPDLFLVVDKSGSMNFGVEAAGCSCPNGGCPPGCPTRWTELKAAMGPFLSSEGGVAHFGMVPFPPINGEVCRGASVGDIALHGIEVNRSPDDDAGAMQATADAVRVRIEGLTPGGGTPTAASMKALLSYPTMAQDPSRPHYALLLTDGLPNCNAANDASSCVCTSNALPCSAPDGSGGVANQCLDDGNTAAEISRLSAAGITTIVLGFGTETLTGLGPATLTALAAAGGFQRRCQADSDCGAGDACGTATTLDKCGVSQRTCARGYFQAGNAAELGRALEQIRGSIGTCSPCLLSLVERPADPRLLSVTLNGAAIQRDSPDGYTYDEGANQVEVLGASCEMIKNSTVSKAVNIEVRLFQEL
jgi:hypothetical protein